MFIYYCITVCMNVLLCNCIRIRIRNQNQKGFNCQEGFYTNQEFGLVIKVHTLRQ